MEESGQRPRAYCQPPARHRPSISTTPLTDSREPGGERGQGSPPGCRRPRPISGQGERTLGALIVTAETARDVPRSPALSAAPQADEDQPGEVQCTMGRFVLYKTRSKSHFHEPVEVSEHAGWKP